MQVIDELTAFTTDRPTVITIGVFDGVHLGHQFLMKQTMTAAKERGFASGVVTFHPHPLAVLSSRFEPKYICSLPERIATVKALGVDLVVPLTFTHELSQLSAREFVSLLKEYLRMRVLLVGSDFALGKGREGDIPALTALGKEQGFEVSVVDPLIQDGEVVSSTAIRTALAIGDVTGASRLLGRSISLSGEVVKGDQRGRTIGFPTANIAYESSRALPADGVYATQAYHDGKRYASVTNIGVRPTFEGRQRTVEVFLLGFKGDLYNETLTIEFIERLRGEQKFSGLDELKSQIERDVERARVALRL